jgi:hypothetical protein
MDIKDLISENKQGLTLKEIIKYIYKDEGRWKQKLARGIVFLMLEYLEEGNQIKSSVLKKEKKYYPHSS